MAKRKFIEIQEKVLKRNNLWQTTQVVPPPAKRGRKNLGLTDAEKKERHRESAKLSARRKAKRDQQKRNNEHLLECERRVSTRDPTKISGKRNIFIM